MKPRVRGKEALEIDRASKHASEQASKQLTWQINGGVGGKKA